MHPQTRRYIECVVLLTLTGTFARMEGAKAGDGRQVKAPWGSGYRSYIGSQSLQVGATVRTFAAGHADFRRTSPLGPGRYADIFTDTLGPDGKPVFASTGARVEAEWRDASGRSISPPRSYIRGANGDTAGRVSTGAGGAVQSAQTTSQWFRDTPGVNTSTRSGVGLQHNGANYVFDGSLDSLAGGNRDYTAELEYNFVYEPGRDWFISAGTNAELWVYIDDKLVIDGGGLGGVTFRIENGAVITTAPVEAQITVVGAAIQSGSTPCPVTVRATAGSTTYQPFGSFTSPTAGNVNTPTGNPRRATLANVPPGTSIKVSGSSYLPGRTSPYMTAHSYPANQQVKVFKNGDTVPDIRPMGNQTAAKAFLAPYVDPTTRRVTIADNQAIFLFELGTSNLSSTAADFQDLVVLLTLSVAGTTTTGPSTTVTEAQAAPSFNQRIDLGRLDWLEDRGSHKIRVYFANRTGASSTLRLETNITTLNLANQRSTAGLD